LSITPQAHLIEAAAKGNIKIPLRPPALVEAAIFFSVAVYFWVEDLAWG
jgi:hypothetical protein